MRLLEVTINNYKTVSAEATLAVDPRITALVGKSESGKTNILQAINSVSDMEPYTDDERCSWLAEPPAAKGVMVWLKFEVDEADVEALDPQRSVLLPGKDIRLGKRCDGTLVVGPELGGRDEQTMPDELKAELTRLRGRSRALRRALQALQTERAWPPDPFATALQRLQALPPLLRPASSQEEQERTLDEAQSGCRSVAREIRQLSQQFEAPEFLALKRRATLLSNHIERAKAQNAWTTVQVPPIDPEAVRARLPEAVYIRGDEVALLADGQSIDGLRSRPEDCPLYVTLLKLGDLQVSDLVVGDPTERDRRLLRGARKLSEHLTAMWSQERVIVDLDVEGDEFRVRLEGSEGHFGKPGQRSEGFLWFVSFYLAHLADIGDEGAGSHPILLLDEPGLHLHASAQKDLLRLFEQASERAQIIYATHSPFMINRNYPYRIRAVRKDNGHSGTWIDNKPYHSERGFAWEPVRTAIGLTPGNSLLVAANNLVVEGISDYILVGALSQCLASQTPQAALDLDQVAITPAGGADNVVPLAHFCATACDNAVVLLDSDKQGTTARNRLKKAGLFPDDKVVAVGDVGVPGAVATEDLVDAPLYHRAVQGAYEDVPDHPAAKDLPGSYDELANEGAAEGTKEAAKTGRAARYTSHFKKNEWGDFDKALVASRLAKMSLDDQDESWGTTLANFEKLFAALNEYLRRPFKKPAL